MFLLFQGFQPLVLGVGFGTANLPSEVGGVKHKRWNFETSYRLDFTVNQSVLKFSGKPKLDSVGFNKKKVMFHLQKNGKDVLILTIFSKQVEVSLVGIFRGAMGC